MNAEMNKFWSGMLKKWQAGDTTQARINFKFAYSRKTGTSRMCASVNRVRTFLALLRLRKRLRKDDYEKHFICLWNWQYEDSKILKTIAPSSTILIRFNFNSIIVTMLALWRYPTSLISMVGSCRLCIIYNRQTPSWPTLSRSPCR